MLHCFCFGVVFHFYWVGCLFLRAIQIIQMLKCVVALSMTWLALSAFLSYFCMQLGHAGQLVTIRGKNTRGLWAILPPKCKKKALKNKDLLFGLVTITYNVTILHIHRNSTRMSFMCIIVMLLLWQAGLLGQVVYKYNRGMSLSQTHKLDVVGGRK